MDKKRRIIILGSTGSIGRSTLEIVRKSRGSYRVTGLAAGSNLKMFIEQIREFRPEIAAIGNASLAAEFEKRVSGLSIRPRRLCSGMDGLRQTAGYGKASMLVSAMVGAVGLMPTLDAIKSGKDIALANKEILVIAGGLIMKEARARGVRIMPVDSEHSAIFQCLEGHDRKDVCRIILTASGGPFYAHTKNQLRKVSAGEALKHPTWNMGAKISVDSATLMNKGLEIIEAHHLFGMDISRINVLIHPQSVVHSMVEFIDGSVISQLGVPDMRIPIQYALTYPRRRKNCAKRLRLENYGKLTFLKPDFSRFPCLGLALDACRTGGTMPVVLNAANEVAVGLFLSGRIKFTDIPVLVAKAMKRHGPRRNPGLEEIIRLDGKIREEIRKVYA